MSLETRIYAIYDVKTGHYGPVMTFVNDGTAIRSFQEMLTSQDPNSLLSLYPSDYILFCLGLYDQETGKIECCPAPMNILSGSEAFVRACVEANDRRKRQEALQGKVAADEIETDYTVPRGCGKNVDLAKCITDETISSVSVKSE